MREPAADRPRLDRWIGRSILVRAAVAARYLYLAVWAAATWYKLIPLAFMAGLAGFLIASAASTLAAVVMDEGRVHLIDFGREPARSERVKVATQQLVGGALLAVFQISFSLLFGPAHL
jgi:hypothetical protein